MRNGFTLSIKILDIDDRKQLNECKQAKKKLKAHKRQELLNDERQSRTKIRRFWRHKAVKERTNLMHFVTTKFQAFSIN